MGPFGGSRESAKILAGWPMGWPVRPAGECTKVHDFFAGHEKVCSGRENGLRGSAVGHIEGAGVQRALALVHTTGFVGSLRTLIHRLASVRRATLDALRPQAGRPRVTEQLLSNPLCHDARLRDQRRTRPDRIGHLPPYRTLIATAQDDHVVS